MKFAHVLIAIIFISLLIYTIPSFSQTQKTKNVIINFNGTNVTYEEHFSTEGSNFNYTFSSPSNFTFYIEIPKGANVLNASLNISGFYECFGCGYCAYNPGTGPNCTCPTSGLSQTELQTLNTTGSCPGGCSQCTYTPSPSNGVCSCTNPYSGSYCTQCSECYYYPTCSESCSCTNPYSGGGSHYETIYYTECKQFQDPDSTQNVYLGGQSHTYSFSVPSGWSLDHIDVTVGVEVVYSTVPWSGYQSGTAYVKGEVTNNGYTWDSTGSCTASGNDLIASAISSTTVSSSSVTVEVSSAHFTLYSTSDCSGTGDVYTGEESYGTKGYGYVYITSSSTSGYPSCPSGWTQVNTWTEQGSCDYCYSCTYTPSTSGSGCEPCPSVSGHTVYGGGCSQCSSCSYTPPSPDCTCPSPASGGSCPGGCEVCGYIPDFPSCTCKSPYTGGGCADYGQPENVYVVSPNGTLVWSMNGYLNETNSPRKIILNTTKINQWLKTCTADQNGNCLLPVIIHSDHKGKVNIQNINVTYTFNVSSMFLVDTNSGKLFWNQTTVYANKSYRKIYKIEVDNATVGLNSSGFFTLNSSPLLCWVNGSTYQIENSSVCMYPMEIFRNEKYLWYVSEFPEQVPAVETVINRTQDYNLTTTLNTIKITYPESSIVEYNDGKAYSTVYLNLTNFNDTGQDLTVVYSYCPQNFECYNGNGSVVVPEGESKIVEIHAEKNAIIHNITLIQKQAEPESPIVFNLTDIWINNDTIPYKYVKSTYILPPYSQVYHVFINGVDYLNTNLVNISGNNVTIVWNGTLQPNSTLDPEIVYSVGYVEISESGYIPVQCSEWGKSDNARCYKYCPDCYSEVGHKVRWTKTISVDNTGSVDVTNLKINTSIPKSTIQGNVAILNPNGTEITPEEINIDKGYVVWTIPEIKSGEKQIWTIKINTTPPTLTYNESTEVTTWTKKINLTGSTDLAYNKVWTYTNISERLVHLYLYDNTTYLTDVTHDPNWGPPAKIDTNGNGYPDMCQWITPTIYPNQTKHLLLKGTIGLVECNITKKEILNKPIYAGENVVWKWTINCTNLVDVSLTYSKNIRLPLESSNIFLDGNPIEAGFYTVPPYGPYITIEGSIAPYSSVIHTLEFKTPPVTVEVSPPRFPQAFYVGQEAKLIIYVNVKNWASENITDVVKSIDVSYANNLTVYLNSKEIDRRDVVKGYYELNITNIKPYESRTYMITYYIPTATAQIQRYFRRVINKTQYIVYPVKITSVTGYPLSPLYITFEEEHPFRCSDVAFVILSNENDYLSPPNSGEKLQYECKGNRTEVRLKDLPTGQSEYIDVFIVEKRPSPITPLYEPLYNFFDWLYSKIIDFINWLISAV